MNFAGQVVWITGASSGIGEALARAFAAAGARLVLSSRRTEELERVRRTCARPEEHLVLALDLAQPATFPALTAEVLARCGRIDVLVNNGGVSQRARAIDASFATERALMDVNYFGPVALTKAVLPSMLARRSGQVVVVSSVMGYVGTPGRSTYAAAKHALHGYFDSLRTEVWREGIHVMIACPGYVNTAVTDNALGPTGEKRGRREGTHIRGIAPEKCAAAIVRGVWRRRNEVHVGGWEVLGIYLQRYVPWLYARVVRKIRFSVDDAP
ncbi:SDR family oxidoreductase [Opitutus sp. ER46]|uniref:SDR family oxidoreductase n=1 Tax=Opitutus sp. ER46 TaxID=2161864 RepID=UPI000D30B30D|nr:SDR family oxidoreductase [Opitutus sp. ER46]PTX92471.1 short chain dehydrogenase [Opitutus sp. ER46]